MLNQILNTKKYSKFVKINGVIAASCLLSLVGMTTDNKALAITGISGVSGLGITLTNENKKRLEKLDDLEKKYQDICKHQADITIDLKELKIQYQEQKLSFQELSSQSEQQIEAVNQEVVILQEQSRDERRTVEAISILCGHKFNQLEEEIKQKKIVTKPEKKKLAEHKATNPKVVTITPKTNSLRPSKTFVFLDEGNYYKACKELGFNPNYRALMNKLKPDVGEFEIFIYVGVFKQPSRKQKALIKKLENLGYRVFQLPINEYSDGSKKIKGDDVKLASDLVEMAATGEITSQDKVIIISGDGDYFPALEKVKRRDINITLIACNPSPYLKPFVDRRLCLARIQADLSQDSQLDAA